jgi:hypothetical protein
MRYEAQKTMIALVFTVYIASSVVLEYHFHGKEMYPVFSWSLFSIIPNPTTELTIRVRELDGIQYDPPLTFQDLSFLFAKVGGSPTQYTLIIARLRHAIENNSQEGIDRERVHLEALFGEGSFQYDLVKITYDPLEFMRTRKPSAEQYIASFSDSP